MTRKAAARSEQLLHLKSYGRMALTNYLPAYNGLSEEPLNKRGH
ncbi:hypothetical protein C2W64_04625 [Brevibacillus laterosporus]|nr:hypothetical protein C2W64_04625 [Brevibacillus laterosporus]